MENNDSSSNLNLPEQQSSTGVTVEVGISDSSSQKTSEMNAKDQQRTYSDAWFKDIESKVFSIQEELKKIRGWEESLNPLHEGLKDAKKQIASLQDDLYKQTRNSLEFFGIFATLFTFISVSASTVLQFRNVFHSVFFLAAFCFCLLFFLHLFHMIVQKGKLGTYAWIVFYVVILLVCGIGGSLCYYYGNKLPSTLTEDTAGSIQINYTQTNGYEQNIPAITPINTPVSK